jgi:hypothetical protein
MEFQGTISVWFYNNSMEFQGTTSVWFCNNSMEFQGTTSVWFCNSSMEFTCSPAPSTSNPTDLVLILIRYCHVY